MSVPRRLSTVALVLALAGAAFLPPAGAAEVAVKDDSCTIFHTTAEQEEVLALSGVFAANWSAAILRDIPSAGADMAMARTWHADKTSGQLADMPEPVRQAIADINAAGQRVGYRADEATAPLRLLIDRNDRRASGQTWYTLSVAEARELLDAPPTASFSDARRGLSVAAEESWLRSWERTPGAQAEAEASRAELKMCVSDRSGTVDRATASPTSRRTILGTQSGQLHTSLLLGLLEEVAELTS